MPPQDSFGTPDPAPADTVTAPLRLDDLVDVSALQCLMDDFYALTGLPIGILDLESNVLVGTGWQDVCTKFHRVNPDSLAACVESDRANSVSVPEGRIHGYKCANGMWDVVTPIMVAGAHVANIFVGQFVYEDEDIDLDYFRAQAQRFGFDEDAYIDAVSRIPRFSHETLERLMRFYVRLAGQIAAMGHANMLLHEAIEARDHANRVLRESEARFRTLIESAPIGIAMARDGRVVYANRVYATMFGYDDPASLQGVPILELVAPDARKEFGERAAARWAGLPAETSYETVALRRDGREFPLLGAVTRIDLPDGPTTLGFFQDTTALKAAERALGESEEKFATAFQTSPDAVTINRLSDGMYVEINRGFTELLGYTAEEVAGKSSADLGIWVDPADRDRLVDALSRTGICTNLEASFRAKNGHKTVALMSARMMDFGGERCILAVTRDISERKHAEDQILYLNETLEARVQERTEQLAGANEELREVNERLVATVDELAEANRRLDEATQAKNEFLASMSHELRTPLNSILGFSGTMLGELAGPVSDEQRRQLGMISNSGRHLLELINGLLDLAKIESGQTDIAIGEVDFAALVSEVVDTVRPMAAAKGLSLRAESTCDPLRISSDRTRIRQILLNLLGNAVKFTDEGGIVLSVERTVDAVRLHVRDTGRGIAVEDIDHIFDQYYQGVPPEGGKSAGTGLGLAVSRRLASMLGGDLSATSVPGEGSVFTLVLPV